MDPSNFIDDLRSGKRDLLAVVHELCQAIDQENLTLQALVPEPLREERLRNEAIHLLKRYPNPKKRPPLFGVPIGVKDIIHVKGWPTLGGSQLPAHVLEGTQGSCVTTLRRAGALIVGKTTTAEFAGPASGPACNPYRWEHTAGNSSGGSAAGVARGYFPFALGTQTIGSVNTPAAFCGVVGFKPSRDRIASDGILWVSPPVDTLGWFASSVKGIHKLASLLCHGWDDSILSGDQNNSFRIAIPEGPYLNQISPPMHQFFAKAQERLQRAGYALQPVRAFENIDNLKVHFRKQIAADLAHGHQSWFSQYPDRYHPKTVSAIQRGQTISKEERQRLYARITEVREMINHLMHDEGIDVWLSPATFGSAPLKINERPEDCNMNLPWSYAGLPVLNIPVETDVLGLPLGLQLVGSFGNDELLLNYGMQLESTFSYEGVPR